MLIALLQSIVLSGATVHSFAPGKAPALLDVLVQDDRIVALAPTGRPNSFPADARRVDLTGMHLIPGLIDGLVNHDPDHDRLYVVNGVTLVRDMGSELTPAMAERDAAARERGPGPWICAAGAPIVGAGARSGIVMATPEEATEKFGRLCEAYHLDYVSVYPSLGTAAWKKLIPLAHAHGLRVWGQLLAGTSLSETIEAGQDGIFNIDALLPAGKGWAEVKLEDIAPRIEKVANAKIGLVPTIALHAARIVLPKDAPELGYLAPLYIQTWTLDALQREHLMTEKDGKGRQAAMIAAFQVERQALHALWEKHAVLVPGSASPGAWLLPGRALIEELVLWGTAGIPAPDVLRAATIDAARALGAEKERGSIEAGKVADMVAYAADPELDLAVLREPKLVVLRGRVLERGMLDGLLADLKTRAQAMQLRTLGPDPVSVPALSPPSGELLLAGKVEQRVQDSQLSHVQGMRLAAEDYAVSKRSDGTILYATHMVTLGGMSTADTALSLTQGIKDDRLVEFELEVKSGPRTVNVKGTLVGNVLNIERRLDGGFTDNTPVKEKLTLVDVGSVLSPMILAHHARSGALKVLWFEDFEPAYAPWEMRVDNQGTILARTHTGALTARFDEKGLPAGILREQGNGVVEWSALEGSAPGGGWPIPEANRTPSKPVEAAGDTKGATPR